MTQAAPPETAMALLVLVWAAASGPPLGALIRRAARRCAGPALPTEVDR